MPRVAKCHGRQTQPAVAEDRGVGTGRICVSGLSKNVAAEASMISPNAYAPTPIAVALALLFWGHASHRPFLLLCCGSRRVL